MMSRKRRLIGYFCLSACAVASGVFIWLATEGAISTPSLAASVIDGQTGPVPHRFEVSQSQIAASANASSLPGGASSLSETYKDWRVACTHEGTAKRCVLSQAQAQQNGQRVLAIELSAPSGNAVSGMLVLPFGLALDSGVSYQIDEKPVIPPMRFRTCLPIGCLVPVSFDASTLAALRTGTALKLKATADSGAAAPFSISLQGFATTLDRVGTLSR
ncbi:invasion associated locus B family protein [Microvirga rosea]|nr:invasion associated locus B family protein [Microvirga rosea]MCB8822808.1 invasion associated locus B family protein [Microvirga rosea]